MIAHLDIISLSIGTAVLAVSLITPIALATAWYLVVARKNFFTPILETLIFLPMVLPPVVVGLLLLNVLPSFLLLTWKANVLAQAVVAFPLYVKSIKHAFLMIPKEYLEASQIISRKNTYVFIHLYLPLLAPGMMHGALLSLARALGEFGATVIVAGIIPHKTETLSLGIYARIISGNDKEAWILCMYSSVLAFILLILSRRWEKGV